MNFVGHAHVASAIAPGRCTLVLGAMLPDFASMCRARLLPCEHPELAAGIALHHRTDEAFHACPEFVDLCTRTAAALEARGVPWGAARAAAHVGCEMLLDGVLLRDEATRRAYRDAVRQLEEPSVAGAIRLTGGGATRWPELVRRAKSQELPEFYDDPQAVGDRLIAILAPRPRLALDGRHREVLHQEMVWLRGEVERARDALIHAARAGIEREGLAGRQFVR